MNSDLQIGIARHLVKLADEMMERADNMVEHLAKEAVETNDPVVINELIEKLPHGFHRTELRVFLAQLETQHE